MRRWREGQGRQRSSVGDRESRFLAQGRGGRRRSDRDPDRAPGPGRRGVRRDGRPRDGERQPLQLLPDGQGRSKPDRSSVRSRAAARVRAERAGNLPVELLRRDHAVGVRGESGRAARDDHDAADAGLSGRSRRPDGLVRLRRRFPPAAAVRPAPLVGRSVCRWKPRPTARPDRGDRRRRGRDGRGTGTGSRPALRALRLAAPARCRRGLFRIRLRRRDRSRAATRLDPDLGLRTDPLLRRLARGGATDPGPCRYLLRCSGRHGRDAPHRDRAERGAPDADRRRAARRGSRRGTRRRMARPAAARLDAPRPDGGGLRPGSVPTRGCLARDLGGLRRHGPGARGPARPDLSHGDRGADPRQSRSSRRERLRSPWSPDG